MVTDTEKIMKTVYFTIDDYNYVDSLHNDNFHEAIRIVIKKSKKSDTQSMMVNYMQFIVFGIITLGIGSILNPNTSVSVFFFILGAGLVFFGIYNLFGIITRIRRVKKL